MGKHSEWRKLAKKLRRKRIRTKLAVARDQQLLVEQRRRDSSPNYKAWLEEQAVLEQFKATEEKRLAMQRHQIWEAENEAALLRWREQQSRLAHAKAEKFKREMLIKEEWERDQRKLQEAEESRKKAEDEKKRKQTELLAQIDAFIEGKAEFPEEINWSAETQPGQPECPFFSKTGACRFRDCCSRNHVRPGISRTLLVPNFYDHFGLQTLNHDEYDTDVGLEYEDSETYQHFKEFYKDVLPEFEQSGTVTQFRVCNNEEPHLRGNVYVEFASRRHSLKAYRTFQGRFYAGRRLNVEFTNIPSWKNAVCGLYHRQKCPKGKTCNFLHVFKNPNNAFKIQEGHSSSRRQFSRSRSRSPRRRRSRSRSKEWSWSEGSVFDNETSKKRSHNRSRVNRRRHDSESENSKRRSRSRSQGKKRNRSRSPAKRKDRSRSRSQVSRKNRSRSPPKRKGRSRSLDKRKAGSKSRSPNRGTKKREASRDRQVKRYKEKKRNEKNRSKSRSPQRDKKHYNETKTDSKKKTKAHRSDTTLYEETKRENNGKDDVKQNKDFKKYSKESKKEKNGKKTEDCLNNGVDDKSEHSERHIKKHSVDDSKLLSKHTNENPKSKSQKHNDKDSRNCRS